MKNSFEPWGSRSCQMLSSLHNKRFRAVSEQRKTEERDSRLWPREKWNEPFFARSLTLETARQHFCPQYCRYCFKQFVLLDLYIYLFIFFWEGGWERVGKGQVRVICLVISVFLKLKCLPSFHWLRGRENNKKKWCSLILAPDIISRNISVKIASSKVYLKYAWLEVTFAWLFQPRKTKYFWLSFGQRCNQRWRPLWWKAHLN